MLIPPDFGRCRTLVVWGVNPLYSNSVKGGAGFLHAVDRGAKVIVADPKCTPTTEYAQLHLWSQLQEQMAHWHWAWQE